MDGSGVTESDTTWEIQYHDGDGWMGHSTARMLAAAEVLYEEFRERGVACRIVQVTTTRVLVRGPSRET